MLTKIVVVVSIILASLFHVSTSQRIKKSYACQGSQLDLECNRDETIFIIEANYGRTSDYVCGQHKFKSNTQCYSNRALDLIKGRCDAKNSCVIQVTNKVFGNPCHDTFKYAEVKYKCIKGLMWYTMFYMG